MSWPMHHGSLSENYKQQFSERLDYIDIWAFAYFEKAEIYTEAASLPLIT